MRTLPLVTIHYALWHSGYYRIHKLGLLILINVLGTWLTAKIGKRAELSNIFIATNEATSAAQTTVLELQQTVVEDMKAAGEAMIAQMKK